MEFASHPDHRLTGITAAWFRFFGIFLVVCLSGCWRSNPNEVIVYASLDQEFSQPLLDAFEQQTQVDVLAKFDVESTKTVGLVNAIIQERNRPRCDVFWNNEILHTLRLEQLGLLEAYSSPAAADWPTEYRSPDHRWYGFAARARVLIVNTGLLQESERPDSIEDLANEKWRGKVAIAKPLFGTTATHAAILFNHWGDETAIAYFQAVKRNAAILSGNKQVAESVARGDFAFGVTDTDDAIIEREKGAPVEIVFPDQEGMGTLFIPNTIAIIRGSKNTESARRLVDFLLSPPVEESLATGPSAQFPVNPNVERRSRVLNETTTVKWMTVDFSAAAESWERASTYLRDQFASAE